MESLEIIVLEEQETRRFAERLSLFLLPGDTLCLKGDLGAGKTTFTRFLSAALGSPAPVSSPTFTLIHEYHGGRAPIYHADAYRLQGSEDATGTGIEEYIMRNEGILILEWPERITEILPSDRLDIKIEESEPPRESRRITITPHGGRWSNFIEKWSERSY